MNEDDDEKALDAIVNSIHPRLQQKFGKAIPRDILKACIRQMRIEPSPIRVVDVTLDPDGKTVHTKLELPFRFRFPFDESGNLRLCAYCSRPCHCGGDPCVAGACRHVLEDLRNKP